MNRQSVKSSNLASIGYNTDSQTLEVEFLNGSIYHYFKVPADIFENLMSANSHGTYFSANIRGKYSDSKIS